MDRELRGLHRGARDERGRMLSDLDPHDVPGYDRATGIDDPVPDAEYGDDHPEPADGYPEEADEERVTLPILDGAGYDVTISKTGQSSFSGGVRSVRTLALANRRRIGMIDEEIDVKAYALIIRDRAE